MGPPQGVADLYKWLPSSCPPSETHRMMQTRTDTTTENRHNDTVQPQQLSQEKTRGPLNRKHGKSKVYCT